MVLLFSDGVTGAQHFGVGLAADNQFLFAGNTNNNSISVMRIMPIARLAL